MAVASQSQNVSAASAFDGVRSCIPLRDSPGFSPGSLFATLLGKASAASVLQRLPEHIIGADQLHYAS